MKSDPKIVKPVALRYIPWNAKKDELYNYPKVSMKRIVAISTYPIFIPSNQQQEQIWEPVIDLDLVSSGALAETVLTLKCNKSLIKPQVEKYNCAKRASPGLVRDETESLKCIQTRIDTKLDEDDLPKIQECPIRAHRQVDGLADGLVHNGTLPVQEDVSQQLQNKQAYYLPEIDNSIVMKSSINTAF